MTTGRNDRCPCGSGQKYKHCCARKDKPSPPKRGAEVDLVALAKAGRYCDMEAAARGITDSHPSSGLAWKALSVALQMQGKEALQALERAARLLPEDAEAQSNLGVALRRCGRLVEAAACLHRALKLKTDSAEIWTNLGNVERDLGDHESAVTALREALRRKPEFAKAHNNLGNTLLDLGRIDEAEQSYRRALKFDVRYTEAYVNLGAALRLQGRSADAQSLCERALAMDGKYPAAITLLAHLRSDQGQFSEAEMLLGRAIVVDPDHAEAWAALVGLRRMSRDDQNWLVGAERIAARAVPRNELPLRFAIGKFLDDVGDYDRAFQSYRRANELAKKHRRCHDRTLLRAGIDGLILSHTADWLRNARSAANLSERPVLVVGMPRSGTTLAEQILASHPQVFGAGELPFWNGAAGRHVTCGVGIGGQEGGDALLGGLGNEYVELLRALSRDALRVVDKMPANFMFLGLIHAALPRARIIHMQRNPIDTCLSVYFQNFGPAHSYANDLDDLAHYYGEYRRIMDHWRRTLPAGVILDVPYERLVEDPEHWSRRMIKFIGLSWDERCRDFSGTSRIVSTFSKWQARQPIHMASVERWRHYEKFVEPLRPLLLP